MSKFWQGRLNASWKETVSSTVTGLSDGAARLRQNLQVPAEGRAAELNGTSPENKTQQYLRLPIESAKKLRWYDRPDLNNLIQQNLREKNDLLEVNAALRQVLLSKGISEDDLEAELEEKLLDVDRTRTYDEGVNSVLIASAADEIASLRSQIDQQALEIEQLKDRLMSAEAAGPSQPSRAVSERSQHAKGTPPRHPSSTNSYLAGPTFVSAAASAPSAPGQPQLEGQSPEGPSAFIHALSQAPASSPYRPTTESSSDCVQLILGVSEASSSVHAMLSPTSSLQANHEQTSGVNQDDLYAAPAAVHSEQQLDDSLSTSSQLAGVELESDANQSEVEDSDHTGELQRLLAEERKKTAALIGKLQRLEEERQMHMEQLDAQDATLEDMDRKRQGAQAQAAQALSTLKEVSDASERQVAHMRAQAATSSGQHVEALCKAQDICSQAESKADAADRRALKAEAELRKTNNDLRARERERDAAEARASAAQAESDRGATTSNALAAAKRAADDCEIELRRSLRDTELKHKQHIKHKDASVQELQRSLAASQQEVASLEGRLSQAEQAEGDAMRAVREAEAAAVDQESLLLRAAALEDKLKESRAEQGQLENYKQLTKELEAGKARVEDEMIATVHIATGLEARLRQAKQDADLAQQQAQQAEQRANQAEQRVQEEAERRVASIGSDRTRWPAMARDEVLRLEKKQLAMSTMLEALQRNLEEECEGRKAEAAARTSAQDRCSAADERVTKLEWESNQAAASLQRKVTLLQQQLEDVRQAAADAEQERDRLALSQHRIRSHSSFGSLGPNTPKRGSGSLRGVNIRPFDDDSGTPTANGGHSREHMEGVDIVYLKNVLLKFVDAHAHGRTQECSTLLPAIAALLRATPLEYRILKDTLQRSEKTGNWWARAVS